MFQSPQAITIALFYFIMFFIISFISFKNLPFLSALKVLTPYLITTILLIYDTDCLVAGGCFVYSWIRTVLYLIVIIIAIFIVSLSTFSVSNDAAAASQAANTATVTQSPATPATPATTTTTPPATAPPATTEQFASWEAFSDVQDEEDFTQGF
jgi:hypothetical protein